MKIHIKTRDFEINIEDDRGYLINTEIKQLLTDFVEQSNKLTQ